MYFKGSEECAALAPWAMRTRPPQSWWLTSSHVSTGTIKMACRWVYCTQRNPSLAVTAISSTDSCGRQIIWFVWSLPLTDPHFLFVLLLDFCSHAFTQPDISFAFTLSNPSHFLFTSLFFSLSLLLSPSPSPCLLPYWTNNLSLVSNRGIHSMWK